MVPCLELFMSLLLRKRTRRVCCAKPPVPLTHVVTDTPQSTGKASGTQSDVREARQSVSDSTARVQTKIATKPPPLEPAWRCRRGDRLSRRLLGGLHGQMSTHTDFNQGTTMWPSVAQPPTARYATGFGGIGAGLRTAGALKSPNLLLLTRRTRHLYHPQRGAMERLVGGGMGVITPQVHVLSSSTRSKRFRDLDGQDQTTFVARCRRPRRRLSGRFREFPGRRLRGNSVGRDRLEE